MRIFIVTIDEPIYLNKYIKEVVELCCGEIVGVAVLNKIRYLPRSRGLGRLVESALLGCLVFSNTDLIRLAYYKLLDCFRSCFKIRTDHTVLDICREHEVPVCDVADPNDPVFVKMLRDLNIDVILHQTPVILRQEILAVPKMCVISRHMSCLPKYRGGFPVFWQFYNDEQCFGLTIHQVDGRIDSGNIILQRQIRREKRDTIASVYKKLFRISPICTFEALRMIGNGIEPAKNSIEKLESYSTPSINNILEYFLKLGRCVGANSR